MSPKIRIEARESSGGKTDKWTGTLIDQPDQDGLFRAKIKGVKVKVSMNPEESTSQQPVVAVESDFFKGHLREPGTRDPYFGNERRTVYVSRKTGRGAQTLTSDTKLIVELQSKNK